MKLKKGNLNNARFQITHIKITLLNNTFAYYSFQLSFKANSRNKTKSNTSFGLEALGCYDAFL